MPFEWIDQPGSELASYVAPIRSFATAPPIAISVSFPKVLPADKDLPEERAFRGGAFVFPYLGSSYANGLLSLVRSGGWPRPPTVWIDENIALTVGALQPTDYSPLAQWALGDQSGLSLLDRSGNNRTLSQGLAPALSPDMRFGHYYAPSGGRLSRADAGLRLLGELTVTLRAWGSRLGQTLISCTATGETTATNALYQMGTASANNALGYFCEHSAGVNVSWTSSLIPGLGKWQFMSLRRAASGVVTINLDDLSETSPALALPTGGTSTSCCVGHDGSGTGFEWQGGLGDVSIWGVRLTDAQLARQRAIMMGLPL